MFSNIYRPYTYLKTRDIIWVRCTFSHETGEAKSNLSCFTDCTKHASAGALFIDNRQFICFLHKQNWAASSDINFIVTYWTLIKHQALLTIQAKFKLAMTLFYFSVEIDLGKSSQACGKRRELDFEVLKRCYIQIYPTGFLLCYGKAVNLQHMWNLKWSNAELL